MRDTNETEGRTVRMIRGLLVSTAVAIGCAIAIGGCGHDATAPARPATGGTAVFWHLTLNHQAVTLSTVAPYDTVRVVGTPRNAFGDPLPVDAGDSMVTALRAIDPTDTSFAVGAGGLLRALYPVTDARVAVTVTLRGVTRTDTLMLNISAEPHPPRLARLVLSASPSNIISMQGTPHPPTVSALVVDTAGHAMTPVRVALWSADTTLASVDPATGQVSVPLNAYRRGRVMIYASTTVYGVTRTDSLPITVIPPLYVLTRIRVSTPRGSSTPVLLFPSPDTVAAGAVVVWLYFDDAPPADVVFDEPAAAKELPADSDSPYAFYRACDPGGHGNIPAFVPDTTKPCGNVYRVRTFPTPGTYTYHSQRYNTSSAIVVLP